MSKKWKHSYPQQTKKTIVLLITNIYNDTITIKIKIHNANNTIKMKQTKNKIYKLYRVFTIPILVLAIFIQNPLVSHAAQLSKAAVYFDRLAVSQWTAGTVCATPTTAGTATTVAVTFPNTYTVSSTLANWTTSVVSTGGTGTLVWPTNANAWPGIGTATGVSSQTVTFPSSTVTPGTLYCFNWTNTTSALQNPGTPGTSYTGSVTTQAAGAVQIDTEGYTTDIINNDQISVTATVPEAFTLVLGANSDGLGTLSAASVSSTATPITVTISTNASNGWQAWAEDANSGLKSPTAGGTGHNIASNTLGASPTAVTAGTEGYNTGVVATSVGALGTGTTVTIAPGFLGTTSHNGGGLTTSYNTIASSNGPVQNAVLSLTDNVAISSITPAANNYADTITVVGGGLF